MSWSQVSGAHVAAGFDTVGTTSGVSTLTCDLLVVWVQFFSGSSEPTLSDNQTNTWNALTLRTTTSSIAGRIYWCCPASKVNASHTFTLTSTGGGSANGAIAVVGFTGALVAGAFDKESGQSTTGSVTSLKPGSLTPTNANSLLVTFLGHSDNTAGNVSIDNSYTAVDKVAFSSGHYYGTASAYKAQSGGPSALDVQWSWVTENASQQCAAEAVFVPAAASSSYAATVYYNALLGR